MLKQCKLVDWRKTSASLNLEEQLKELHLQEGLVLVSKTPCPQAPTGFLDFPLISGPSVHFRAYCRAFPAPERLASARQEHAQWLQQFKHLRKQALEGQPTADLGLQLQEQILEHLEWEEQEIFPAFDDWLGTPRVCRELGYEHQGIRRLLPGLTTALEGTARQWEQFSLDLIHLIEHHIEHEEVGLYPLWERIQSPSGGTQVGQQTE